MGISINSKMSGFRNWAEIHEPTKIDEARTGAKEGGASAAADVHQAGKTVETSTIAHGSFPGRVSSNPYSGAKRPRMPNG